MKLSMVNLALMLIITSYKGMATAESWIQFKGHFYKRFDEKVDWDDAKKECEVHGGYLLEITSEQENNFIKDHVTTDEAHWIGLRVNPEYGGKHKYKFWWARKRELPVFTAWGSNQPDNNQFSGDEECAEISNGNWNDNRCYRWLPFLCEKETVEISCTNEYPVSHKRVVPHWLYFMESITNALATDQSCQEWCTADAQCRSVAFVDSIYENVRGCSKYFISVQKLKDMERWDEIKTSTNTDEIPTAITHDRECADLADANCTYTAHNRKTTRYQYRLFAWSNNSLTAKICQDWCNGIRHCKSVAFVIDSKGQHTCDAFYRTIKETGGIRLTTNDTLYYPTLITYDRDCECPPGLEAGRYLFGFCKRKPLNSH